MSRIFNTVLIALEIVGWDVPKILARVCCLMFSCSQSIAACTLVKTPRFGGQWWSSLDVVMMFARVRRLSVVSVQVISGAGSIGYFV